MRNGTTYAPISCVCAIRWRRRSSPQAPICGCAGRDGPRAERDPRHRQPDHEFAWTNAGVPALSIPTGETVDGLPLAVQFCAPFGADERLLAWGEAIEALVRG